MKSKAKHGTGAPARQRPADDPEQSKRFKEKARELDADESGEAFQRVFNAVVPASGKSPARPLVPKSAKRERQPGPSDTA